MFPCKCTITSGLLAFVTNTAAVPADPHWFEQRVDHFSVSSTTFQQRYYQDERYFAGPGSPIFVIMGGEGGIPPAVGIFYPWVVEVLAKAFGALVIEPEHRFYGESLPFGPVESFQAAALRFATTAQALADTAHFIRSQQGAWNCTARGTTGYCPVLTIGGSYPGFMSAMMRAHYPAIVDMAYAASAPMRFYSQEVDQYEYYNRITFSADRSMSGCSVAVRRAFEQLLAFFANATVQTAVDVLGLCPVTGPNATWLSREHLFDNVLFLAEQTFANLNMANYPPDKTSNLHQTCASFMSAMSSGNLLPAIRSLLLTQTQCVKVGSCSHVRATQGGPSATCFNVQAHLPAGDAATARCGDWSGCGIGHDGQIWDYQTCSFEVEQIGFGGKFQMFPARPWTLSWLQDHCKQRFGIDPQPKAMVNLWGFTADGLRQQGASRILFTNGLNDGWSVGGFSSDPAPRQDLLVINLPNGAHHSDLGHTMGQEDTPDVQAAHDAALELVGRWLREVRAIPALMGLFV